jgi:hypothetical protein
MTTARTDHASNATADACRTDRRPQTTTEAKQQLARQMQAAIGRTYEVQI